MSREVPASLASTPVRNAPVPWDPASSDRLVRVLRALADKFATGELPPVLSPKTLVDLGGQYRQLYFAGFTRAGRPHWAEVLYPGSPGDPAGFQRLVDEVNGLLRDSGKSLLNAKKEVPIYVSHTRNEFERILMFAEQVEDGLTSRADALERLRTGGDGFGPIPLSASQVRTYFPQRVTVSAPTPPDPIRARLLAAIRDIRAELALDLSDQACAKGVLFECFVGALLAERYGAAAVRPQSELPIVYRDLDGGRHAVVYPDFLVHGQPVEVKWRNSVENILTSALAQSAATVRNTGAQALVTVLYRDACEELAVLMRNNAVLDAEAERMDLPEVARPIRDVIQYISIEEFIAASDFEPRTRQAFCAALGLVDAAARTDDLTMIRHLSRVFLRIAAAGDGRIEKLDYLCACLSERLDTHEEDFGPALPDRERGSTERRAEIIHATRRRANERLLVLLYNRVFDSNAETVSNDMLDELGKLPRERFEAAVRAHYEERREDRTRRVTRILSAHPARNAVEEVGRGYERLREREDELQRRRAGMVLSDLHSMLVGLKKTFDRSVALAPRAGTTPDVSDLEKFAKERRATPSGGVTIAAWMDRHLQAAMGADRDVAELTDDLFGNRIYRALMSTDVFTTGRAVLEGAKRELATKRALYTEAAQPIPGDTFEAAVYGEGDLLADMKSSTSARVRSTMRFMFPMRILNGACSRLEAAEGWVTFLESLYEIHPAFAVTAAHNMTLQPELYQMKDWSSYRYSVNQLQLFIFETPPLVEHLLGTRGSFIAEGHLLLTDEPSFWRPRFDSLVSRFGNLKDLDGLFTAHSAITDEFLDLVARYDHLSDLRNILAATAASVRSANNYEAAYQRLAIAEYGAADRGVNDDLHVLNYLATRSDAPLPVSRDDIVRLAVDTLMVLKGRGFANDPVLGYRTAADYMHELAFRARYLSHFSPDQALDLIKQHVPGGEFIEDGRRAVFRARDMLASLRVDFAARIAGCSGGDGSSGM